MVVGILSMQEINNYGSLLQAYALKKIIESLSGAKVVFLPIEKVPEDYLLLEEHSIDFSEEHEKKSGFSISKINKYLINRFLNNKRQSSLVGLFSDFRNNVLKTKKYVGPLDLCVIGSDEVFNCINSGWWGFSSQLFGNITNAKKVITYAASCGSTTIESLPEKVKTKIAASFEKVDFFSVRDINTSNFVSSLSKKPINVHLDPAIIYDFTGEMEQDGSCIKLPKKYCLIYSYRNRINKKEDFKQILSFCKKHRMTPVAVGGFQYWIKKNIPCSPFQCLNVFKNASFVITDTFHGAIFAAKYSSRFAVLTRESNKNKLNDLINRLRIDKHHILSFSELEDKYSLEEDKTSINVLIDEEKKKSVAYLTKAIKWCKNG